ncbi:2-hydroxyacid dehydrogenase [Marinibaculum pumilum]|uniref:2-hydroxyacid dehydrogenase n=1 Tax=Marinibaculum pumilum TaxID=1766165 RepID=A0ABV7L6Y0_9PROT
MTLVLITEGMDAQDWRRALIRVAPEIDVRIWPDVGRGEGITFAVAWNAPEGIWAALPDLRAVSSAGAGVDRLLADPDLPADLPVVRLVDERLAGGMAEYVLLHVLRIHRRLAELQAAQAERRWIGFATPDTPATTVGVLGLGAIGSDVALKLAAIGFRTIGWSRSHKELHGVETFSGTAELREFLGLCDYCVCLLPLTPDTAGILNAETMALLPKGSHLINAGRGGHVVEADLLAALDSGRIASATLDVFATEPLPPAHPFWRHPAITVTPHNAADTVPLSAASQIAENYTRLSQGRPLLNLVDRGRGY